MRRLLLSLALLPLALDVRAATPVYDNPILRRHADPQIFLHTDGQYYAMATAAEWDRIELRRTRDLDALDRAEMKVVWRKHESGPMSMHIWAPELHFIDGRWYIYFTASRADAKWEVRPYVLVNAAADPFEGEWRELGRIDTGWDSFSLDGTTFAHRGQRYFVWTQRGRTPEEGKGTNIYIAKMDSPTTITGKATLLTKPEYAWERHKYDVNEGPAVLIRNGRVFVTFSASAIDANYCLGLLTADADADLLDPAAWRKSAEPVFRSSEAHGVFGPGHNSFTTTPDGKTDLIVYHAREYRDIQGSELEDPNRNTRVQVLRWKPDGTPDFGEPEADLGHVAPKPLYRDPVSGGAADPAVIYSGSFGRWYLFYTNRRATPAAAAGESWVPGSRIGMAESLDAGVTWTSIGDADIELPPQYGGAEVTLSAPDVVRDAEGTFHMFVTVVSGSSAGRDHPRTIVHLVSHDLRRWRDARPLRLANDRAVDPSIVQLPGGGWRMYYVVAGHSKSIGHADSDDLLTWADRGPLGHDPSGEGPKAFRWRERWWLIADTGQGLEVHASRDGLEWKRQRKNLLQHPGRGADDTTPGQHADVVVVGDRAWLFYATHPGRTSGAAESLETRRSSIQVVELRERAGQLDADRNAATRIALHAL